MFFKFVLTLRSVKLIVIVHIMIVHSVSIMLACGCKERLMGQRPINVINFLESGILLSAWQMR